MQGSAIAQAQSGARLEDQLADQGRTFIAHSPARNRVDVAGRVWTSAADGVHCYDPDGTLIGKVLVPEGVANCVFGGEKRNVLYICGTTSLYAVRLMVNGAKTY